MWQATSFDPELCIDAHMVLNSLSIVTEQPKSFKILQLPLLSRELGLRRKLDFSISWVNKKDTGRTMVSE